MCYTFNMSNKNQKEIFINYLKTIKGDKTLGQIEKISGIDKAYFSKLMSGNRNIPKPETLKKLAKALPCSYEELMEKAGYIEKQETTNNANLNSDVNSVILMHRGGHKQQILLTDEQMQTLQNLVKYMGNNPDDLK